MGKKNIIINIIICVIIFIGFGIGILMLTHHRTEYISQSRSLEAFSNVPLSRIKSVRLWWMWGEKTAELNANMDKADIEKLMSSIKEDLWVSRLEVNPYGDTPPAYDEIRINLKDGSTKVMLCWFGKEGGKNPSLNMRSRTGEFKRIVQSIMERKGER